MIAALTLAGAIFAASTEKPLFNADERRSLLGGFADCVVEIHPKAAAKYVAEFGAKGGGNAISDGACLPPNRNISIESMNLKYYGLVFAFSDAFIRAGRKPNITFELPKTWPKSDLGKQILLTVEFAKCVVSHDRETARALSKSQIASSAELTATKALSKTFGACGAAEVTLLAGPALRGPIAYVLLQSDNADQAMQVIS
ncbi:hypothetical protein [Sphingomonas psychrolutea]|uniref:Uncharacterized protein n=1 Tax=Sphingomonas psychrolutea TaxID=1259676 RepID=A0ABQ1GTH1_9SPHN|nr:hypothetical protein [Sphingomonas psychrolutea]GGA50120.1 hypothetical protein GCM10011395_20540 [Sphingomonas psychrolutea]